MAPTVIDLVSSDDEDVPLPVARRRRGHSGREARAISPTPGTRSPTLAPAPAPALDPLVTPPPALAPGHEIDAASDAVGGAEVIDLDDMLDFDEFFDMPGNFPEDRMQAAAPREQTPPRTGQIIQIDGEDVFIPDSPAPVRARPTQAQRQDALNDEMEYARDTANFTADVCLKRVLAMFPDIEHEHVLKLYNDYAFVNNTQGEGSLPGNARYEAIVEKLLTGGSYPRQPKLQRKRKRGEDGTDQQDRRWTGPDREVAPLACKGAMASILKAEFPEMTKRAIAEQLLESQHLYPAYTALAKTIDTSDAGKQWTGRPLKDLTDADTWAANCGWAAMPDELEAARNHVKDLRRQRVIEDAKKWAEKENLQQAIEAGETAECQACFDDLPMNRQIHCNGDTAHFTCFDCATAYVKSEVGDSRCRVLCTAGCGASFARAQLHLLEDKELLEKLEQLQQEKDIRDAGLDNLEECPFCDYKAILPPVEEDFEFRCANELCEKVSCRRCKSVSHIPLSCEEHAKDHKLSSRHKIEEAMTEALIRKCNKCKKGFIKEYGCNKMSCPSCGNLQCYVCSESLKDYNHFDQAPRALPGTKSSKCPLYDNVEERHEREIKAAEAAARAEVINDNPDVSEQDLEIKVSDAVQKATDERVKRAGAVPGGIPPGYGGLAAADGFARGLFLHLHKRAAHEQANVREANQKVVERMRAEQRLWRLQREMRLRAMRGEGPEALQRNPPLQDAAAFPIAANVFADLDFAGPANPPLFLPQPNPQPQPQGPPADPQAVLGGFNEDPFGGGDDGDLFDLHRLLDAPRPRAEPALPVRVPPARHQRANGAAARAEEHFQRMQNDLQQIRDLQQLQEERQEAVRLRQAQQLRDLQQMQEERQEALLQRQARTAQLQAQALQARQRFDDRRGGQGRVFQRDVEDPRRHHGAAGWPGQN